ncbi:pre-mRNA 3'-end-processing factor FIP1 isoform X2 [Tachysurus vachellii]|uniref:pre-mRNA 3'-end-processing factor FIP1 isoform X2 n=1 Tax=Tachysurus vachellii TaxID=175792 RepID=UPI00296B2B77|nr:pre-mRNA 3'-end-processing factor FIP1 isoform X2 [Tachysurus vachellii]
MRSMVLIYPKSLSFSLFHPPIYSTLFLRLHGPGMGISAQSLRMSTRDTEKTTVYISPDDEDWLYGDNNNDVDDDAGDDDDKKTETEIFSALVGDVEGVNGADNQDVEAGGDTESDDNLSVTIGSIKTDKIQSTNTTVNLKSSGITTASGTKVRGVTLVVLDSNTGTPALGVNEELEEKPWRKPGANLSDYFNYGFNEDTWKSYCDKHRRLRMSLEFMTLGSSAKNTDTHNVLLSKSDCSSGKLKSTIDVIEGQAETIIRMEGRRNHSTDGSITQVQSSSEQPVHAGPLSTNLPPYFPPIIPPPPFPLLSISSTPPFVQQLPRPSMSVPPPPGFPLPPEVPSPPFTSSSCSGRPGGSYDVRCAPPYPFAAGVYPHTPRHMTPWPGLSEHAKAWNYSSCQDKDRDRGKDREKTREREAKNEQEKERDQENTPSFQSRSSDRERASRHRDHSERERTRHREHDREGREREREERHRDRRHRDRNERHKSSHSSRRSDDGESHRRHRYKRSKRNKDNTDTESSD